MPWLAADPVIVLPAHREALEALVRAHSTSQQLALRGRMILHAADNIGVRESARELHVWPKTVRYWRGLYCGPVLRHPAEFMLPAVDLGGRVWLGSKPCKGGPGAPASGG